MLVGMDDSGNLGLNSVELSGISDISQPPQRFAPAMVAMARSMEGYDDCAASADLGQQSSSPGV